MKATYVEPVKTPVDFERAVECMRQGLHVVTGSRPGTGVLSLSLAKCALETGRWQSMWNHNWGNAKASPRYEGRFTAFACNEVLGGRVVWFDPTGELDRKGGSVVGQRWEVPPGHPQTRFRAYANPYDGAQEYVTLLQQRFPRSFDRLLAGEPDAFVQTLKSERYFTADPAPYAQAVRSLQREFIARIQGRPAPELDVPESVEVAGWIRLAALTETLDFGGSRNLDGADTDPAPPLEPDDLEETKPA